MSVQSQSLFLYLKHLINKALKLSLALLLYSKLFMKIVWFLIVFVLKMFSNDGIFVLFNAKVEVKVRVVYIICTTQIRFIFKHNVLLVYQ